MSYTLSVIIPVFNEEKTIIKVLNKVRAVELLNQGKMSVIVVNDKSTDGTDSLIKNYMESEKEFQMEYFIHDSNQGKGAAIHTGLSNAQGDYLIIQDADLEYDPQEYNLLLKPMIEGYADVVYGSRFIGGKPHRALFFWHTIGNKFLTFISNMFTNLNLTDIETCYKLFKREIIQGVNLKEKRFGFEPEVTAKISRISEIRIYEVGISYYGRSFAEGKKIGWRDGVRALYAIFKYNVMSK